MGAIRSVDAVGAVFVALSASSASAFEVPLDTVQTVGRRIAGETVADIGAGDALVRGGVQVVPRVALEAGAGVVAHQTAFQGVPTCIALFCPRIQKVSLNT